MNVKVVGNQHGNSNFNGNQNCGHLLSFLQAPLRIQAPERCPTRRLIVLLFLLTFFFSCQPEPCTTQLAFYHWKTDAALDSTEQAYLAQLPAQRLYLRLLDVDWDGHDQAPRPKAEVQVNALPPVDIIPTVYITNRTLAQLETSDLDNLSHRIMMKVEQLLPLDSFVELQIDCDWTEGTREAYFSLLQHLRERLPKNTQLSATLRLHQYRWPEKTGVPPVDRTMLMFYNMGDLDEWQEPNSILNLDKATAYLQHTNTYPLPIDLALPLFRWGVLYRYGKMIKLINGLTPSEALEAGGVPLDDAQSRFRIPESTYLQGYYLYTGDELRLEWITPQQLDQAAQLLQVFPCSGERFLSFYHLDSILLEAFPVEALQQVQQVLDQETESE